MFEPKAPDTTMTEIKKQGGEEAEYAINWILETTFKACPSWQKMNLGYEKTLEVIEGWYNEGWLGFDVFNNGTMMGFFVFNQETGEYDINLAEIEYIETKDSKIDDGINKHKFIFDRKK